MTSSVLEGPGALIPSPQDRASADTSARVLAEHAGEVVRLVVGEKEAALVLPQRVAQLIGHLLSEIAAGHAVTVLPLSAELTSQQAADLLKVSRPYLIGLLEQGQIPFHRVGTHRRVLLSDLLTYQQRARARQQAALTALTEEGQALDLY